MRKKLNKKQRILAEFKVWLNAIGEVPMEVYIRVEREDITPAQENAWDDLEFAAQDAIETLREKLVAVADAHKIAKKHRSWL